MARAGLRSRLSGSVPISIAVHFSAVLLFLIMPLTANMILPDPAARLPDYMRVAPPPPPPPALPVRAAAAPEPRVSPSAAPSAAPSSITPEPATAGSAPDIGISSPGSVPGGLSALPSTVSPIVVQPPDPPRPASPVRVADLPVTPRKIVDARPLYPDIARSARVEGTVVLEAVLDTNGHVTQLRVLQSVPLLDRAALDAVRQWRYTPSLYGGHPVSVLMTITVRFTLQ